MTPSRSGRRTQPFLFLLFAFVAACASPPAAPPSASAGGGEAPAPIDPLTLKALTTPGEELQRLAPLVGEWSVELESLDGDGRALATIAEGMAVITSELGGRYYRWRTELSLDGHPVHSQGLLGFDAGEDLYQFLWLSELASGMRIAGGRGDPERGGIQLEFVDRDPTTDTVLRARTVMKLHDDDHFTLEQWALDPTSGDWIPQRRTGYTRKAKPQPSPCPLRETPDARTVELPQRYRGE